MQYILLAAALVCMSAQQFVQKEYNGKVKKPKMFMFVAFSSIAAMLIFIAASGGDLTFVPGILMYSAAFAGAYIAATVGLVFALRFGSLAITSLVMSYSLIIPTLYGITFLDENIGTMGIIGVIMLCASLFLLNAKKEKAKVNVKWVIFLVMAFVGNGMCSTIQKIQQLNSGGEYKSEFMIIALAISAITMLAVSFATERNKSDLKLLIKYSVPNGLFNGAVNFLILVLTGLIPNAILFPSVSAGGIVLSLIMALLIYKEKLSLQQKIGYVIGTVSVILLNL